ncbi:MAG: cell division protein FtsZ [Alphaproteobacteria bacterium]|nr:cell division protein FtsZ [Alphaproteobacteria bacterium]
MIRVDDASAFQGARIAVVGVGGGGCNVVEAMVREGLGGVDLVCVNTDAQALHASRAPHRFQLGRDLTRGLGAGADPRVGQEAAVADKERLAELVRQHDMVFVVAGMGGGTGTGAAPVVAEVCREVGALTVGVATLPFRFEGKRRARVAADGVDALRRQVDTLVTIPNDRLLGMVDSHTPLAQAFRHVDDVVVRGVGGVASLVRGAGRVNVDFADVRTIMSERGTALLGVGEGSGHHRAMEAVQAAIGSPLLQDVPLTGARHILLNLTGPDDLTLHEVSDAAGLIQDEADDDANLIWGWVIDPSLGDRVRVTLVATGFAPQSPRSAWVSPTARHARRAASGADDTAYDIPSFFRRSD